MITDWHLPISSTSIDSIGPMVPPRPRTTCCFSPPARLVPTSSIGLANCHFTAIHGSLSHLGQIQRILGELSQDQLILSTMATATNFSKQRWPSMISVKKSKLMPFFQPLQGTSISWSWPSSACNKLLGQSINLQNLGDNLQTSQLIESLNYILHVLINQFWGTLKHTSSLTFIDQPPADQLCGRPVLMGAMTLAVLRRPKAKGLIQLEESALGSYIHIATYCHCRTRVQMSSSRYIHLYPVGNLIQPLSNPCTQSAKSPA